MSTQPKLNPKPQRVQHGQALVEFALVVSILFALVFSIISVWPFLNAQDAVAIAAANGAHEAAISGGDTKRVLAVVKTNLEAGGLGVERDEATIAIECAETSCPRYSPISVQVRVPVEAWIDLPWIPDRIVVEAEYTRANELDGMVGLEAPPLEEAPPGDNIPPVIELPPIKNPGDNHPGIPGDI